MGSSTRESSSLSRRTALSQSKMPPQQFERLLDGFRGIFNFSTHGAEFPQTKIGRCFRVKRTERSTCLKGRRLHKLSTDRPYQTGEYCQMCKTVHRHPAQTDPPLSARYQAQRPPELHAYHPDAGKPLLSFTRTRRIPSGIRNGVAPCPFSAPAMNCLNTGAATLEPVSPCQGHGGYRIQHKLRPSGQEQSLRTRYRSGYL